MMAVLLCSAHAEEGLVARYSFDDGSGAVLHDSSGNRNDGAIAGGAKWVKGEYGAAIDLNGTDAWVDCGVKPNLAIGKGGTLALWFKPLGVRQGGLISWSAGKGRPDQRLALALNTYTEDRVDGNNVREELGLYIGDGVNSDRPFVSNNHKAYFPPADSWLFYAATFNGRRVDIYRDGVLVETRFQTLIPALQNVPLWLGRCAGLGGPSDFFKGLMDEARIYDRPLSEQEIYQLFMQTSAGRGKETESFGSVGIKAVICPEAGTVFADLNYRGLTPTDAALSIKAELADAGGRTVAAGRVHMLPVWGRAEAIFDIQTQPAGDYTIRAFADKGRPAIASVVWPGRAKGWETVKVLNNFCWELLNESPERNANREYAFVNPRRGWLYVSAEAEGNVTLTLQNATPPVVYAAGKGVTQEAMRWMNLGGQKISVTGDGVLRKLVVRAVPMMLFWHYPCAGPGTGDASDYLLKHVLAPNRSPYNMVHTHDYGAQYGTDKFIQSWAGEQGRVVIEGIYPATHLEWSRKLKDDTARQQIWDYITRAAGMNKPGFRGVIMDEFTAGGARVMWTKSFYDEWTETCAKILEDPKYAGRIAMPAMGYNMYDFAKSSAFLKMFIAHGSPVVEELYIDERDREDRAWLYFNEVMAELEPKWDAAIPGYTQNVIKLLSYLQREPWNPAVDFKVHLEMQFQQLATRPEFFGLGGVGAYSSYNCNNEEYVRWVAALCRHYGIVGARDRLSAAPYVATQIRNPDFLNGADGWTLKPAENDSMAVRSRRGYGALQERYPYRAWTDTPFLWTRRSAQRPNAFSQDIRNLEAGRLYLVRVWIGDYNEFTGGASKDQDRAVNIRVENAVVWDNWYRSNLFKGNIYTYGSPYVQPFNYQNLFYFKIPQIVFRATGPTARLVVSDWKSDTEPGGPAGQELMFNFVEVRPFFEL